MRPYSSYDGTTEFRPSSLEDARRKGKEESKPYYTYHWDIRYEIENCNDLKEEIENLLKQGHLKQFIDKRGRTDTGDDRREDHHKEWHDNRQDD